MTSLKYAEQLRTAMLKAAVQDNVDTIAGRLPKRLHTSRLLLRRWSRRAWIALLAFIVVVASASVARWPASVQTASATARARETPARGSSSLVATTPTLLAQSVSPDVLALGVRRVIVDAGHGGENLGTAGVGGLLEKDVTLDIAERVRQELAERNYDAVLTRTTDATLSLWQRAAIANGQRGDIFLSIHLNSFRPSTVCGVETYYLGPSNDPGGDALAAMENEQSGYSLSDMRLLLDRIYTDARRDESRRLAEAVQHALISTLRTADPALTDRGVKMAPFVVLVATEMPAILAEVSCLSRAAEARRLRTAPHRQTLAEAVVSGIEAFASRPVASDQKGQ